MYRIESPILTSHEYTQRDVAMSVLWSWRKLFPGVTFTMEVV